MRSRHLPVAFVRNNNTKSQNFSLAPRAYATRKFIKEQMIMYGSASRVKWRTNVTRKTVIVSNFIINITTSLKFLRLSSKLLKRLWLFNLIIMTLYIRWHVYILIYTRAERQLVSCTKRRLTRELNAYDYFLTWRFRICLLKKIPVLRGNSWKYETVFRECLLKMIKKKKNTVHSGFQI